MSLVARIYALLLILAATRTGVAASADAGRCGKWIGSWGASPQQPPAGQIDRYRNQTLRLIVHVSAGGPQLRIRISNLFGDRPLRIGGAHVARRTAGANVDPASDRRVTFGGRPSATVSPRSLVVSDPVDLEVPALSDLAVSLFLPEPAAATTLHFLALQTSYVSTAGDSTAAADFPVARAIQSWPFLTGVDVAPSRGGATLVAFGDSTIDGDGSTPDSNRRWTDVLAARLQADAGSALGVLNEGIIGNRLLHDSPRGAANPLGPLFGPSGLARFHRDALEQVCVRFVIVRLGVNDLGFPGPFAPASERVDSESLIAGFRQLIQRARERHISIVGTTIAPFEGATLAAGYYTPEKELVRQQVNAWIRTGGEFDGVVDLDRVLRDPDHPARLRPDYDSGDHLHPSDAGYAATGNAIPLSLLGR